MEIKGGRAEHDVNKCLNIYIEAAEEKQDKSQRRVNFEGLVYPCSAYLAAFSYNPLPRINIQTSCSHNIRRKKDNGIKRLQ